MVADIADMLPPIEGRKIKYDIDEKTGEPIIIDTHPELVESDGMGDNESGILYIGPKTVWKDVKVFNISLQHVRTVRRCSF